MSTRAEAATTTGSPRAVTITFAAAGFLAAAAFARVPSLRDQVDANFAQFSGALLCLGLGSVLAMPWSGRITDRWSSAWAVRVAGALAAAALAVAGFADTLVLLGGCLFVAGIGIGVWDVSMNVQGHAVETRRRRVLMPGWHAAYSFGSVAGALTGAGCAALGVPVSVQFATTSVAAMGVLAFTTGSFVDDSVRGLAVPAATGVSTATAPGSASPPSGHAARSHDGRRRGVSGTEVVLGLIVLATAVGEGAANDWLGLLLVDERELPEAFGGVALAGFNLTMGCGRLAGGPLITRFGRVPVLRVSGLLAATGVLVLCLVDHPAAALLGAAAWGLGLAAVFPAGMSAAGEIEGRGPRAIAVVSTIGYAGFLLGAPLIGQLTRVVPLDRALLVVALAGVLVTALAFVARERAAPDRDPSAPDRPPG